MKYIIFRRKFRIDKNTPNSIIDFTVLGKSCICFIEYKFVTVILEFEVQQVTPQLEMNFQLYHKMSSFILGNRIDIFPYTAMGTIVISTIVI